jgi:hypothetical protein
VTRQEVLNALLKLDEPRNRALSSHAVGDHLHLHLRFRLQQPLLKAATPIITYQHALDGGSGTGHSQPEAHRALFFFLQRETPVHWDPGLDRPGCLLGAHGETGHKVFEEMLD